MARESRPVVAAQRLAGDARVVEEGMPAVEAAQEELLAAHLARQVAMIGRGRQERARDERSILAEFTDADRLRVGRTNAIKLFNLNLQR